MTRPAQPKSSCSLIPSLWACLLWLWLTANAVGPHRSAPEIHLSLGATVATDKRVHALPAADSQRLLRHTNASCSQPAQDKGSPSRLPTHWHRGKGLERSCQSTLASITRGQGWSRLFSFKAADPRSIREVVQARLARRTSV